jgi:hypothetical protein
LYPVTKGPYCGKVHHIVQIAKSRPFLQPIKGSLVLVFAANDLCLFSLGHEKRARSLSAYWMAVLRRVTGNKPRLSRVRSEFFGSILILFLI